MKIAFVCNEYPPRPHGGIGSFVHDLAHGLAAAGHEILVAGWGPEAGVRMDGPVRVVTLQEARMAAGRKLVNRVRLKWLLEREARAGRVEIVEAPDYDGPLPWGVASIPSVVRLHMTLTLLERSVGRRANHKIERYERNGLARSQAWIGVSRHVLDLTRREFGVSPRLSANIHNFVPPANGDGESTGLARPYVVYVGSISRGKGAVTLARAACEFLPRHPGVSLVYVGSALDGGGPSIVEEIRGTLGPLAGRVVFTGWLPRAKARAAMQGAAAFVFPSTFESSSLVTLEAMSEGCPVVVSNQPPFTEFVRDGETGLLVTPGDPAAVAAAVSRLLDSPELVKRLTGAARRFVTSTLTIDRNAAETVAFYEKVLADWRQAR